MKNLDYIYSVYLVTNLANGKIYVGKTKEPILDRLSGHFYDARSNKDDRYFMHAIRKHGEHNFKIELIEECSSEKECLKGESFWILKKKSHDPSVGYNLIFSDDEYIAKVSKKQTTKLSETFKKVIRKPGKYGFGVGKDENRYMVTRRHIGENYRYRCDDLSEAQISSDKFAIFSCKATACLNFPDKRSEYDNEELLLNFNKFKKEAKRAEKSNYYEVEYISNSWAANLRISGKLFFLGLFEKEEDAALAVDMGKFHIKGRLGVYYNFPEKFEEYETADLGLWFKENLRGDRPTVPWIKEDSKYCVSIKTGNQTRRFGQFSSLEKAIEAWDMVVMGLGLERDIYFKNKINFYKETHVDFLKNIQSERLKDNFYGIKFKNSIKEYEIVINHNKTRTYYGSHKDPEIAAKIYDYHICKLGLNKPLNFPDGILKDISQYEKFNFKRPVFCETTKTKFLKSKDMWKFIGRSRSYIFKNIKKTGSVDGFKFSYDIGNPEDYSEWDGVTLSKDITPAYHCPSEFKNI
jgi:group I intron endonuclease